VVSSPARTARVEASRPFQFRFNASPRRELVYQCESGLKKLMVKKKQSNLFESSDAFGSRKHCCGEL
jgi:hypothetical protein